MAIAYPATMRPTPRRFVKSICLFMLMGFLVINMNLLIRTAQNAEEMEEVLEGGDAQNFLPPLKLQNQSYSTSLKFAASSGNESQKAPAEKINDAVDDSKPEEGRVAPDANLHADPSDQHNLNVTFVKSFIAETNRLQQVRNLDKFDLRGGSETVVIVVQVHNRPDYLHHLVDSLRKARNIEHSLLIFSHDYYSEELNSIVAAVDFCPVLQIFYPYPMQIYSKEFPGVHPNDCPRDIKKPEALKRKCNNAEHPDKYGHYREAKYCQTKHHWFWKLNHVFDHVAVMRHHSGPVLLIEEDHYMVEDFIPLLQQMYKLKSEQCKECSIITLGTYDKNPTYAGASGGRVEITDWVSSKHNMGMALNRDAWQKLRGCAEAFCRFDDYNWDWSLQFISMTCIKGRLKVLLMKSPRIYHIGECGVHHKGKNCNPAEKVRQIEGLLSRNKQYLYPDKLLLTGVARSQARLPKANGGWGDHRDHEMCLNFTKSHSHR